jgi:hypothetical protein
VSLPRVRDCPALSTSMGDSPQRSQTLLASEYLNWPGHRSHRSWSLHE